MIVFRLSHTITATCISCISNSVITLEYLFELSRKKRLLHLVGKPYFSDQFKKVIKRYKKVEYKLDIMRHYVCLVVNPITVNSYGLLFNCTAMGKASDSMTTLT